jgi:multicomponent Na+:H+ antiporter subunit F
MKSAVAGCSDRSYVAIMETFYLALAMFLVLTMAAGLVRVLRGPGPADRLLTAQLFGTTGVAILLVLSEATGLDALRNVGLVFALLAVLIVVCYVRSAGA